MALERRSSCGLGRRRDQLLSVFLAKETLLPSCVGIAPHLGAREATRAGLGSTVGVICTTRSLWPVRCPFSSSKPVVGTVGGFVEDAFGETRATRTTRSLWPLVAAFSNFFKRCILQRF